MSPRIGLNFNELLKTSIEIVDTEGWEALTISYLAKKLTIQPPSIYNHVKNLEELKNHVALHGINQLFEQLRDSIEGKVDEEAIYSLAFAYLDFARIHPGLYKATLSSKHTLGEAYTQLGNKILDLIFTTLKPYDLSEIELIHTVRGLRSILHGFVSLENDEGFGIDLPINESVLFVLRNYVQQLKSKG
ncbi:TetR/AcrR family transcriptional regulator [Bacillus sp. AFS041924]|uniref:TetR/AcrR family transcriptional regulator n=1 Tax=Bacillus sp. AFS041924 TaxID=2033503 RepID=UPI000BFD0A5A|nr:TetR/AcrR family transcriptional regulator [Bacillus sp. AFS041924]PGS50458.1 TetR family transcriptional regulator [Bacillus sp. AFS041924]